jgi:nucleotide-binding universal stress UspA family protein
MYERIIVPLDGSQMSVRAIRPALVLAEASDAPVLAVSCSPPGDLVERRRSMIQEQLDQHGARDVELRVPVAQGPVAPVLAELLEEEPGSLVVMASVARSHTAAIIGSVAEELLHQVSQPVLLVGPHVELDRFTLDGPLVVPVDGSKTSEAAPAAGRGLGRALRPPPVGGDRRRPAVEPGRRQGGAGRWPDGVVVRPPRRPSPVAGGGGGSRLRGPPRPAPSPYHHRRRPGPPGGGHRGQHPRPHRGSPGRGRQRRHLGGPPRPLPRPGDPAARLRPVTTRSVGPTPGRART